MQTKHDISNIESISSIESFSESMYMKEEVSEYKPIFDQSRSYSIEQTLNDYKQGEQFKYINGYPSYLVSNFGRISYYEDKVKRAPISIAKGYYQVSIQNEFGYSQFFIHRLVSEAFLGECPENHEVDHIDRNRQNNQLSNLRYVTKSQNSRNRSSYQGHSAEYFQVLPSTCIKFNTYQHHTFDRYFIDTESNQLYSFDNNQYRKLILNKDFRYRPMNINGKFASIFPHKLTKNDYNQ
ncbi:HNH_endonuclease [Hexamita inflata]|uniref:HNH endonuclease n=1 Tax=Hexamita inflata TaxID=28002 RepID=A0AA86NUY4_9EUKA|nr:HNH endonuclease [Hexamita inflata]